MATTEKGHIEQLRSGSYRVSVYGGSDPVTGKQIRFRETCPDETAATIALGKLLKQAEGRRAPDRNVLFGQVLDTYLEVTELAAKTRVVHKSIIRRIIRPVLGDTKARKIGPETLDALNAHLKRCSRICANAQVRRPKMFADDNIPGAAIIRSTDTLITVTSACSSAVLGRVLPLSLTPPVTSGTWAWY
jgi:hypothetical protein